jgi:hypothetical protein
LGVATFLLGQFFWPASLKQEDLSAKVGVLEFWLVVDDPHKGSTQERKVKGGKNQ